MKIVPFAPRLAGLCAAMLAASTPATATILVGTSGTAVELVLTLVDTANAKLSYTKDLGIDAAAFWIQAQQDTGASLFRTLDPTADAAFNSFITQANLTTTRWMVFGGSWGTASVASFSLYTTQTNNGLVADQQKYFDKFHAVASTDLVGNTAALNNYFSALNTAKSGVDIVQSNHNKLDGGLDDGSSLASKSAGNTKTYTAKSTGFSDGGNGDGDCIVSGLFCVGNPLGKSSWFYKVTPALDGGDVDGASPVVIDEFDNLQADGYWGLIKDPNSSKYILSYTLAGANPKTLVSTDTGRSRQSSLDYSAQYGAARLIGEATASDVIDNASVSTVPEPQSWALLLAGGIALGALARRQRQL